MVTKPVEVPKKVIPTPHYKIPAELLREFAEYVVIGPPGPVAGILLLSPDLIRKLGTERLAKLAAEPGFQCIVQLAPQETVRE